MSRNTIGDLDNLLMELDSTTFDKSSRAPSKVVDQKDWEELDALVEKFEDMPSLTTSRPISQAPSVTFDSRPVSMEQPKPQALPTPTPMEMPPRSSSNFDSRPVSEALPPPNPRPLLAESENRRSVFVSNAPSSGNCAKCNSPITGEHVLALGKMWHVNHLSCATCSRSLQGDFYDHNNTYVCKDCMERDFKCSTCHQPITGEYFTGNGLKLHPHCVTRNSCNKCGEPITSGETAALGKTWHTHCFSCYNCGTSLDTTFYPKNNEPYCRNCANTSGRVNCALCQSPISGSYVSYKERSYHDNCFKCTKCASILDSSAFYNVNNNPHCHACATRN